LELLPERGYLSVDLARDNSSFSIADASVGPAATPAGAALTAKILNELLTTPETSRVALTSALQESARQFERLLSFVSGTFYRSALTRPRIMEFISPGIAAITGYGPDYFLHTPFSKLIDPEDIPCLEATVRDALARREHFTLVYQIRHRSGQLRWVSERGAAIYDADGKPAFLEGFITDITTAKDLELQADKARKEVEQLNGQMSRILAYSLEGVVSFDENWNYRFANRSAMEAIGPAEELLGKNILEVYPEFAETEAWPVMRRAMEQREPVKTECLITLSGRWYELYAVPDERGISAFFHDTTDRKLLEEALLNRAQELSDTLDSIPAMVWTAHPDGAGDYYNKCWNEFIGRGGSEALGSGRGRTIDWLHPDDVDRCWRLWCEALDAGEPFEAEMRMRHHSGEYRWLLARSWPQRDENGNIVKWCGAATDIHERILAKRDLQESQTLQTNILEASTDCIQIMDLKGGLTFINASALRAATPIGSSIVGQSWFDLWPERTRQTARSAFRRALHAKVTRFTESHANGKGELVWWDIALSPIRSTDGSISNVLCVARDVTEQKATSERLRAASEQDVLTGLPNRRAFEKHLKKATAVARETGANVGLMLLDLDHFKHVNDTLGHLAGDHLLRAIARRVKACIGEHGFVARLGGDEFAVVLSDMRSEGELIGAASRILAQMEAPITFAGKLINGGLSIGCAVFPRDGTDAQSLLRHTDTALYDLKSSGRGGIQMFNTRMMEATERTANQLALARAAIRDDAVEPYYQPKVRLNDGTIVGFEALLRWWSPGNGIQQPSSVAEAFNDYELSTKIGGLMQNRVFADMAEWLDQGLRLPPVSINAAPAEFLRDDYAERLLGHLREFSIPPKLIEVEITEHVLLERRSELVVRALEMLKKSGVRIALDDFGTGHSSLSHLRDFPVDVLKIDRSFVSRMLTKPRMLAIVQAITKLGPSLSLDIVAEGVESPEQLHALRDAGCEIGQGYLFGKAMDSAEIGRRLRTGDWPFKLRC